MQQWGEGLLLFRGLCNEGGKDLLVRLTSVSRRFRIDPEDTFAKVHMGLPSGTKFEELWAAKVLQPRDVAIVLVLLQNMHPTTGKIHLSVTALAERLGITVSHAQHSISRLKRSRVLVNRKDRDTGALFFLINPMYASAGVAQRRGLLYKQFSEAMSEEVAKRDRDNGLASAA